MIYPLGTTSQSIDIRIVDDSGVEVTGLVAATITALTWSLAGPNADNAFGALSDLSSLTAAYSALGVKERGNGVYRLDVPDIVFGSPGYVTIRGSTSGQHVLVPPIEVIANTGLGNGANTVTLTVTDSSSNPLDAATVTLTLGAARYSGTTNTSGQVTFNVNNGTWTVAIFNAGYTFAGATLAVAGNTTHTYAMSTVSITPSNPGFTTGYFTCYDQTGAAESGVTVTATIVATGPVYGNVYDNTTLTETSSSGGLVQFPNLALGATYSFVRGSNGTAYKVTIPTMAGTTYQLPSIIGSP